MQDYSFIWNHYDLTRNITMSVVESVSEEAADIIPSGFNNNIRWNLGHILVSQELFLYGPNCPHMPKSYPALFQMGSKPADWQGDLPSLDTLAEQFREQNARIKEEFAHRLTDELPKPFALGNRGTMYTFGETFLFSLYHEGMHISAISALRKAIAVQSK